ncbi:MAG: hypothetical protein ABIX37_11805 [Gammaproteobacteria bacterium]
MKIVLIGLALAAAVAGQAANAGGSPPKERACSKTASAAHSACLYDVLDTFWINTGKCKNTADATERAACFEDLRSTPREGREECQDQKEARLDLCEDLGESPYDPVFEASNFVNPADIGGSVAPNPWLPIIPGQTQIYRSGAEEVTVHITGEVKVIDGVPCAVVIDTSRENGEVLEDTVDWFAQDLQGTVWYCGESTAEYEEGRPVSVDGSFEAGVDGARPGIVMKGAPMVGDTYRQEFDLGNAEDAAEVLSLTGSATAPGGRCTSTCVVTEESTALEPGVVEKKYYAPGIGLILVVKPASGTREELIQTTN